MDTLKEGSLEPDDIILFLKVNLSPESIIGDNEDSARNVRRSSSVQSIFAAREKIVNQLALGNIYL